MTQQWAEAEPYELDINKKNAFLQVDDSKLIITYKGVGQTTYNHDVGSIQANCMVPLQRRVYYYEFTVISGGERGAIAIGFAPGDFKIGRQPGRETGSYGYQGDDGRKHTGNSGRGVDYGPRFSAGDTVGAALHLQTRQIFFTKNGERLGVAFEGVDAQGLLPTVGLHSPGEKIELNFGRQPFKFDVREYCRSEAAAEEAAVARMAVASDVTHGLVRSYLQHFGYAATLASFDAVACQLPSHREVTARSSEDELPLRHSLRQAIGRGDVGGARKLLRATRFSSLMESAPDRQPMAPDCEAIASATVRGPAPDDMLTEKTEGSTRDGSGSIPDKIIGNGNFFSPSRQGRCDTITAARTEQRGTPSGGEASLPGSPQSCCTPPSEWDAHPDDAECDQADNDAMKVCDAVGGVSTRGARDACADVGLHLNCQQFVELIRENRINEAVTYGQQVLSMYIKSSPGHAAFVASTFALIAYSSPSTSPLAHLLSFQRREATADVVNAAILGAIASDADTASPATQEQHRSIAEDKGHPVSNRSQLHAEAPLTQRDGAEPERVSHAAHQRSERSTWAARLAATGVANGAESAALECNPADSSAEESLDRWKRQSVSTSARRPHRHKPVPALHTALAQLATVHQQIFEANGCQGERFDLNALISCTGLPPTKSKTA